MNELKEMRAVLYDFLKDEMAKNEKIVVIDADLGKANGTHALRNIYPDRAIDVGVAEQNMASTQGSSYDGFIVSQNFHVTTFSPVFMSGANFPLLVKIKLNSTSSCCFHLREHGKLMIYQISSISQVT